MRYRSLTRPGRDERLNRLRLAIGRLPANQRIAFERIAIDRQPTAVAAAGLGLTSDEVETRLADALVSLSAEMNARPPDPCWRHWLRLVRTS